MNRLGYLILVLILTLFLACAQKESRIGRDNPLDPASPNYLPPVLLDSGLVAFFPFNGNANDESGGANPTTVSGATLTSDRFGDSNSAYLFNGTNSNIQVTATAQTSFSKIQSFSISLWLKTSSIKVNMFPLAKYNGTNNEYDIIINHQDSCSGAGIASFFVAKGSPACAATPVNDDAWHLLIGVYSAGDSKVTLYLDGTAQLKKGTWGAIGTGTANILIGGSGTNSFAGSIDDVRIYNRILNSSERDSLWHDK
jgi:hypothetical protein